jgi:hypothetical protein
MVMMSVATWQVLWTLFDVDPDCPEYFVAQPRWFGPPAVRVETA